MFFIAGFVKKFGKRNVLMTGAAIMIVGYGIMGIGAESLPVLIAGCMLRGVGNAGISACMFAMVTDTIEYGEWKTGIRTEGLINSAASFGQKIGNGLSNVVMGAILAAGGYVGTAATQTASAISAIKVSYIMCQSSLPWHRSLFWRAIILTKNMIQFWRILKSVAFLNNERKQI